MTLEPGPDGLVRDMRSSWDDRRRDAEVDLRARDAAAGRHGRADRLLDRRRLVRLRLVHRRRERPRRPGRAARQDRLRRADGDRARRHRDGSRLSRAARCRRASVRRADRCATACCATLPPGCYAVALALWTLCCALLFGRRGWRSNLLSSSRPALAARRRNVAALRRRARRAGIRAVRARARRDVPRGDVRSLDRETLRALAYALGIKRRDALLRSVADASTDAIVCIDPHGTIQMANPATSRMFGCVHAALFGARSRGILPGLPERRRLGLGDAAGHAVSSTRRTTAGGRSSPSRSPSAACDVRTSLRTAIVRDISGAQAQQRALEHQATHDPLTGLPNRTALLRYLGSRSAERARDEPRRAADARPVAASRKSTTRSATTSATRCCAKSRAASRRS